MFIWASVSVLASGFSHLEKMELEQITIKFIEFLTFYEYTWCLLQEARSL